jgi:polysaccharide export outer membrane protein
MGRSLPLLLTRLAGMGLAGLLLFALFAHAHAQGQDNYGLNRFPGDNYDQLPPGAGIAPPPAPRGYAPVPGSSIGPNGTYTTLNGGGAAQNGYQPVPQQPMPPLQGPANQPPANLSYRQPMPQQPAQPQAAQAYGYRPLQPAPASAAPYGYRDVPPMQGAQVASAAGWSGVPATSTADYVLGPGDKLKLTVYGETDLSGEFAVDGAGTVRLPLIGQVRAAGGTAAQLEQTVASALAQGYLRSPRVAVEVTTYRPFYVIGAVNRPGQYPYVEHMSAMNAIALAGGFNPSAVESVVFIRREGSNQEFSAPVDRTTPIYPGDVVTVHTTIFSDITNWLSPFSGVAASAATAAIIQ